ncbi:MAG: Na+/H+ antiporter NhaA [Gemmatimonadaceae bacterium]|nr:Na+/H+ antiporter NhaA [Gemmatimonadaceae bacterium]
MTSTPPRPPILKVAPKIVRRVLRPFQEFARIGSLGGIVLLVTTAVALTWSNSPYADTYFHIWETQLTVGSAESPLTLSLHQWINDALMVVFFLLVGLEIKREIRVGELSSPRQAALPIVAAIGGMVVPALLYVAVTHGTPAMDGWGIPMATDIAFALGILALLGPRVPIGLKVFLAALAIVDDLGAVLVIAIFYTSSIAWGAVAGAAVCLVILLVLNVRQVADLTPYMVVGIALWFFFLQSGIHSTIAGVLLALTIPTSSRINAEEFSARARRLINEFERTETGDLLVITSKGQQDALNSLDVAVSSVNAPLLKLEHSLTDLVAFGIMPLFALSNAGVRLSGVGEAITSPVSIGIALGLVLGKMAGITLFSALAVRWGVASLPAGVTWRSMHGAAWLGGIGFTMSLFIAGLAFRDAELLDAAKLSVLVSSCIAGVVGFLLLYGVPPVHEDHSDNVDHDIATDPSARALNQGPFDGSREGSRG